MVTTEVIIERVSAALPGAQIRAMDLTGGGDHWRLEVVAEQFRDMSLVEQHQAIYKALGELMKQEIHALALDTKAP